MYRTNENISAIKTVQRMLGVRESGRLDEITRSAIVGIVGDFDGEVDYYIFNKIKEAYRYKKLRSFVTDRIGYELSDEYFIGYVGGEISYINQLLARMISVMRLDLPKPRGSIFSKESEIAVKGIREIFNLSGVGLDYELVYRMIKHLHATEDTNNSSTL